jgi:peroxiredoxin
MTLTNSSRKIGIGRIALAITCIALIVSNVLLMSANRKLGLALEESKRYVTDIGYRFSDLPTQTLDGEKDVLRFEADGKQTILFVFRSTCQYCLQQYAHWRNLVDNLDTEKFRVVALTSEQDRDVVRRHVANNGLMDLDIRIISAEDMKSARLMFTPMTLLATPDGTVAKVWPGLWVKEFDLSSEQID